ncbi:triose-phosphate isomerase [Patescibacteria group bacterium]|nr:triose-phosphate isomerase [Patescibacteria group bacterium]
MKSFYLVANWKSNKTVDEAIEWISKIKDQRSKIKDHKNLQIVLCAPYTVLATLKVEIEKAKLPIHLGAQDISPFGKGAYTGEINADMLKGLIEYVLVGHSERRKYFHEKEEELSFEVLQAHSANFQIIYCIEDKDRKVPEFVDIIAYEPIAAIGSGKPENLEDAQRVCKQIKEKHTNIPILYGGSVTPDNIAMYLKQLSIDGVLVGGASLDPERFFHLIEASFV